ncbi:MAG: Spy/CpxP family protein refolding chaperone [Candidatus Sumerlaeia bacterium]|nr:Spy/CpxP family protein refolding chaperone [Candidatus Sumerlaeia bacterium]
MLSKKTHNQRGAIPVWVKITLSVLAILTAVVYALSTYSHYTKGLPSERPSNPEFRPDPGQPGPPPERRDGPRERRFTPEERRQFAERMAKELNLTPEQVKKLEELREQGRPNSPEEARQRMEKMREILTPEQQEKMRQTFRRGFESRMQRQLQRAQRVLPPDQFEIFKKRLEERRNRFRGPGGDRPRGDQPPRNQR